MYRAGADKVSIGSEAVYAVEDYLKSGVKSGNSCMEQISKYQYLKLLSFRSFHTTISQALWSTGSGGERRSEASLCF